MESKKFWFCVLGFGSAMTLVYSLVGPDLPHSADGTLLFFVNSVVWGFFVVGTVWMIREAIRNERNPWLYVFLALFPFVFIWYYFVRVRPRRAGTPLAPNLIRTLTTAGWICFFAYTTSYSGWIFFRSWLHPHPTLFEALLIDLPYGLVYPLGTLWMIARSLRTERHSGAYMLLAPVPYAFVWYYFECANPNADVAHKKNWFYALALFCCNIYLYSLAGAFSSHWTRGTALQFTVTVAYLTILVGAVWMFQDVICHERPVWPYVFLWVVPVGFVWYYFVRVRPRRSEADTYTAVPSPPDDAAGRSRSMLARTLVTLGWVGFFILTTCLAGRLFQSKFALTTAGNLELSAAMLFFSIHPFGALWMIVDALRNERHPGSFIALALVPYGFVWYCFERERRGPDLE
jgi:hypothetical protein